MEEESKGQMTRRAFMARKRIGQGDRPQSLSAERAKISQRVMASFAQDLREAGFFKRISLYWKIRKEIERELGKMELGASR